MVLLPESRRAFCRQGAWGDDVNVGTNLKQCGRAYLSFSGAVTTS
jgi:hypothetical protein